MSALILLSLSVGLDAQAKRPAVPVAAKVPSIEEVVEAEGFTPTPSQSEIYKPGTVLVPNGRGGHDVVVERCIDAEPSIAIMSQSSIATTLSGGVSARLGVARGGTSGSIEKRLSFVDPEQRTIPLAKLRPTGECVSGVQTAGGFQDLSSAILLHDVLVAIIKNSVCTKADASGGVVALGAAEAAAYSECVTESDGQVPLGYKAVPLSKVLAVAGGTVPASSATRTPIEIGPVTERGEAEVEVGGDVDFAELARRAAQAKAVRESKEEALAAEAARIAAEQKAAAEAVAAERARLEEQERVAAAALAAAQRERLATAKEELLAQAAADLGQIQPLLDMELSDETRPVLVAYVDKWGSAKVRVDDLTEDVDVPGIAVVRRVLDSGGAAGIAWVDLGKFQISKTEVTVGQYGKCVDAGACTPPDDKSTSKYCNWGYADRDAHPVNCVDWHQATAFATWAGGRLPTGDEWTYAATSGGQSWDYPWGDEAATCSRAVMDDGGDGCGEDRTWPVCSKPAGNSTQGVCDLAGNVLEWTQETDAAGRVFRGGSWVNEASNLHASVRDWDVPSYRNIRLGFRLAR